MEKEVPELITVEAARDSHRWVAITALLLAIGVILHTISPNVGGVTPNWTIAMYSITTNLTHPGLLRALGTGFVAGLTIVPSSKSAFPLGNIASEIAGSLTACLLVKAFVSLHLGKFRLVPLIIGFFCHPCEWFCFHEHPLYCPGSSLFHVAQGHAACRACRCCPQCTHYTGPL